MCSVAEAAEELGVSPSTVWRWIDAGRLPAFRIGPKAIRIRRRDLAPAVRRVRGTRTSHRERRSAPIPGRMSDSDAARALAVLEAADELGKRILRRRHGKPLPDSTPLIRAARLSRPPAR